MRKVETLAELRALPTESEIRVNGSVRWVFQYANLMVAGTPLLEAIFALGHGIEVEIPA
jgi:hypothetical protein